MQINTVTIIGANGAIGSKIGGLLAAFTDARIFMMARSIESAQRGVKKAMSSIRSSVVEKKLIPCTLEQAEEILGESDWVFESVVEELQVKKSIYAMIDSYAATNCIVTTGTSGISVNALAEAFSEQRRRNFWCTHFFNPPMKLTACEIIKSKYSDASRVDEFNQFLEKSLCRTIVPINSDRAAFAGNYVGFRLFEMAANSCEQNADKGGIDYVDYVLGNAAGNTMAPMTTLDYVGLDVYQSIVENIHDNVPAAPGKTSGFIRQLIQNGFTGKKKLQGLYDYTTGTSTAPPVWDLRDFAYRPAKKYNIAEIECVREFVRHGRYEKILPHLLCVDSNESHIVLSYILSYILHSFELIPDVVSDIRHVDAVMMYGFAWAPPTFWLSQIARLTQKNAFTALCEKFDVILSQNVLANINTYIENDEAPDDGGFRYFAVDGNSQ
ncbi:MAG: 3-hydroxyacyl-CoA dehydrogenase family protein [Deltaproteobacteria bacterium]|nr:3-hydroxyacyl-CoA dehydrogenase family protein [Deltaproteobacteria bacterium]